MHKFMEIMVYVLAAIGLACIVKHIHKKVKEEKRTGSRYGSNPVKY